MSLKRSLWVITISEKSDKNHIILCSQSTKRLDIGTLYQDIMRIWYYDKMILWGKLLHAMLYCIILFYTILHNIVLYYNIYYTVLYCVILYYTVLYCIIWYYISLSFIVLCYTAYHIILYYSILSNIILFYTRPRSLARSISRSLTPGLRGGHAPRVA